jgi:Zn-dependent M28 family amino/carboxypeptidase
MRLAAARIVLILVALFAIFILLVVNPTRKKKTAIPFSASAARLRSHVEMLANTFRLRDYRHLDNLEKSATYIRNVFTATGARVEDQVYSATGSTYRNVVASFGPESDERIIVGAHYDAVSDTPGADDNASGVAGLLELAGLLKDAKLNTRVDLVAYSTEEPPFFGSDQMGSMVHARSLRSTGAKVRAMLALEMIGYYSDEPGSQSFPFPAMKKLYPDRGNFIVVAGRISDELLTRRIKRAMTSENGVDVYSVNAPAGVAGVSLSDNSSYWNQGYPAVMITDSAFFRNHHYHQASDTPDTLDYERMAKVVAQVAAAVVELSRQ